MTNMPPIEIFIAEVEAFGGAERADLALSRWLYDHGIANRILTYRDSVGLAKYASHPVDVITLNPAGGFRSKLAVLKQHFAGVSAQPRLIVSGYQPALHATLVGARGFHCLMHDTPALFSDAAHRSLKAKLRIKLQNFLTARGLRSGGTTIVTSEFLRSECRKDFGIEAQIARMGGLPSADGFHERAYSGTLNLLSVSRIENNKRVDWMLQSLAALEHETTPLSSRFDWQLRLAGKGSQIDALRSMAESLGIAQRVHFLGFVSDGELKQLIQESHLFLMPALQGFGIPAVEALQSGMPVLLHRESGVSDILLDTPWATVFEGGAKAMAPALLQAMTQAAEGHHLGHPLPPINTEEEWAERVAKLCHWV
ncbi:glycosyltransferase family 4 protein [Terriglobus roseus]|uniref:Glycosyltransferase involved in cell wall bisynthesis n=1 Tax=Terriglobus roseus TaxID=392734 RepID=A0A1G7J7I3_9BACT|nr:glycosyltransferase family 4 protein [Terriglobus roseus]SDF20833.1 Glycosyltransferase involved in cell wall bisynthesis [Terriglobus roseus]